MKRDKPAINYAQVDRWYESGDCLSPLAIVDYPNLQATPRQIIELALSIHDTSQQVVRYHFPDWRNHYADRHLGMNIFGNDAKFVAVENARLDAIDNKSPIGIGSATINLVNGRRGLRFGDNLTEILEYPQGSNVKRRFHLSQYEIENPVEAYARMTGSLVSFLREEGVATRSSLITIDVPPSGEDGTVTVALYRHEQIGFSLPASEAKLPLQLIDGIRADLAEMAGLAESIPPNPALHFPQ